MKKQTLTARQRAYVGCVVNALVAQLPAQWRTTGWEYAVFVDKEPNAFRAARRQGGRSTPASSPWPGTRTSWRR